MACACCGAEPVQTYPDSKKVQKRKGLTFTQTTKTVTNQKSNRMKEIEIDGIHVEILPLEGKVKHLGQMITFMDQETSEVQHRIRCAWSTFTRHRQELTSFTFVE